MKIGKNFEEYAGTANLPSEFKRLHMCRLFRRREFEEHLLASSENVRRGITHDLHDDLELELTRERLMADHAVILVDINE